MQPQFEPLDEKEKENTEGKEASAVQKAKDAAEIQKYETERVEAQRQAKFALSDIKDTEDLQVKIKEVAERESQLEVATSEFENKKAKELSEIQKQKAELEQKKAVLNKWEAELTSRTRDISLREQLITDREELMNSVEKQKLEEVEKYNSLVEQLKREFPRIVALLGDNANVLIKAGFKKLGYGLWDEIEQMESWYKNDIGGHCNVMVKWLREEIDDCNKKAVEMAHKPRDYSQKTWDKIVDNLEAIYKIMPDLRPEYLPKDDEPGAD